MLCFLLDYAFGHASGATLSPPPPTFGQTFDRWIRGWKLMQHPEISSPTDYMPATEAFFISVDYRVLVLPPHNEIHLLSRLLSVFQNWIVYLVFRRGMRKRDSSMVAFLLVFDNLMQGTTVDYWKIPLTFQIINCSWSSTAATKWNTVGLFIWFFGWGRPRHWIQRKWMLNMQAFAAEYRKGFW